MLYTGLVDQRLWRLLWHIIIQFQPLLRLKCFTFCHLSCVSILMGYPPGHTSNTCMYVHLHCTDVRLASSPGLLIGDEAIARSSRVGLHNHLTNFTMGLTWPLKIYCIAGNFGEVFNLAIWWIQYKLPKFNDNWPIELNVHAPMAVRIQIAKFSNHAMVSHFAKFNARPSYPLYSTV